MSVRNKRFRWITKLELSFGIHTWKINCFSVPPKSNLFNYSVSYYTSLFRVHFLFRCTEVCWRHEHSWRNGIFKICSFHCCQRYGLWIDNNVCHPSIDPFTTCWLNGYVVWSRSMCSWPLWIYDDWTETFDEKAFLVKWVTIPTLHRF